ncbi:MAG: hypothetical protein GZ091_15000 [Paludibacter sp.]|nr:hypothetical protein [Paludibacter sp.]
MKNVLKVWLQRRQLYNNPNSFYGQVTIVNSLSINDIIDEIVKDGLIDNRECAIEIMNHFNRKSAELLLNGNNIDTGLVKLSPQTNGYIRDKSWDPELNDICASFTEGSVLMEAKENTTIEIIGSDEEVPVHPDHQNDGIGSNAESNGSVRKSWNDNPPCGIAFRNWILQA